MSELIFQSWTQPATKAESQPKAEVKTPSPAPAPKTEQRRRNLRARISMPLRVRTADFSDGSLEQVSSTQNTSRKGFYFHTASDRYYPGMRLRITFPYHGDPVGSETEEIGEVVRVDKKSGCYGVAITLSTTSNARRQTADTQSTSARTASNPERRAQKRVAFVASVEMMETRNEAITRAHTSDLSLSGCYIDTLNPLPLGTTFDLWIQKSNEKLEARAKVCTRHPGSGMGIAFDDLTPDQSSIIKNWLFETAVGSH